MEYDEYRKKVIECKKSGMTSREWCKHERVEYETYCTWRKRVLGKEGAEKINSECGLNNQVRKKPRTYTEYREKVLECRGSGMLMEEWCKKEGIKYNCYRTWQRRVFEKEEKAAVDKECGRKPREKKDYSLEKANQNPDMYEISDLFNLEMEEIKIETHDGNNITIHCGVWTVSAIDRSLEDVIRAVKKICL